MASDTFPRPAGTRDRILDAFEAILNDGGERGATLDAVAARAGVSKGGLLYHFGSKDALIAGLLERLRVFAREDVEAIRAADAGAVDYLIRTSVNAGEPFDQAFLAAACLAQGAHAGVRDAIAEIRVAWHSAIAEAVGDPDIADVILLVSDGLYANSALMGTMASSSEHRSASNRILGVLRALTPSIAGSASSHPLAHEHQAHATTEENVVIHDGR